MKGWFRFLFFFFFSLFFLLSRNIVEGGASNVRTNQQSLFSDSELRSVGLPFSGKKWISIYKERSMVMRAFLLLARAPGRNKGDALQFFRYTHYTLLKQTTLTKNNSCAFVQFGWLLLLLWRMIYPTVCRAPGGADWCFALLELVSSVLSRSRSRSRSLSFCLICCSVLALTYLDSMRE